MILATEAHSATLVVKLTQGAVDNGYISIGRHQFAFFPVDVIANDQGEADAAIELVLPTGEKVTTAVLGKFGRLQKRFGTMFKQLSVCAGDQLQLARIGSDPYRYQLTHIPNGSIMTPPTPSASQQDAPMPQLAPSPLNQILYGPPGTGKTYHTINKALAILDPVWLAEHETDRQALKTRFDELVKEGRIDFVTFHQSFSYEDFVEGLRAFTREDGSLEYRVEPGVFAQLCELAQSEFAVVQNETPAGDPFDRALQELQRRSEQAEDHLLQMKTDKGMHFKARYNPKKRTFSVFQQDNGIEGSRSSGNMKNVRHLYYTGDRGASGPSYVKGMLDYLVEYCNLPDPKHRGLAPKKPSQRKPFVLIIDEINRGNVSRIFGELITLIEPSKRAGRDEALSTTLPYSKDTFSVPDNLYLIGTMNTADRSLAGLDIALRRRFVFEEMPPRAELLNGVVIEDEEHKVDVGRLLHTLNQRIEVLLDRDHCLGHAYFMPLKATAKPTLAQLGYIFQHQILPLLQEYFFEDWQRIAWVLNDHRKSKAEAMFLEAPKLELKTLLGDIAVGGQRQRWSINEKAFRRIEAYVLTIEGDKGAQ